MVAKPISFVKSAATAGTKFRSGATLQCNLNPIPAGGLPAEFTTMSNQTSPDQVL
jgi:hypothetical protein